MKATLVLLVVSTLAGGGALAAGYALGGFWSVSDALVISALLWLVEQRGRWAWISSLFLVCLILVAAGGIWLGLSPVWMLIGVAGTLTTWDLEHFVRRVRSTAESKSDLGGYDHLARRHLGRVLLVDGVGLALGTVALLIQVNLSFGVALALGLLAVLGVSQMIAFLRRSET